MSIGVTLAVYHSLLDNFFFSDDFVHLYDLATRPFAAFLFMPFNGHVYVVRNLGIAAMHALFGFHPGGYFAVVLLAHVGCVALLFQVIRQFTGSTRLAGAGAALWGTAPVQEGTVGWLSVYGQVLVALVFLGFLVALGQAEARRGTMPSGNAVAWSAALVASSACFAVGIVVAFVAPLLAFLLLPSGQQRRRACLILASLWIIVPALYALDLGVSERLYGGGHPLVTSALNLLPLLCVEALTSLIVAKLLEAGVQALQPGAPFPPGTIASAMPFEFLYFGAVALALTLGPGGVRRRILTLGVTALGSYAIVAAGKIPLLAGFNYANQVTGASAVARTARYHYIPTACLVVIGCVASGASPRGGGCRASLLLHWPRRSWQYPW